MFNVCESFEFAGCFRLTKQMCVQCWVQWRWILKLQHLPCKHILDARRLRRVHAIYLQVMSRIFFVSCCKYMVYVRCRLCHSEQWSGNGCD